MYVSPLRFLSGDPGYSYRWISESRIGHAIGKIFKFVIFHAYPRADMYTHVPYPYPYPYMLGTIEDCSINYDYNNDT